MRADFARFFEDVDIFRGKRGGFFRFRVLFDQIGEMQRAGKAAGAGADDEDIGFEGFALDGIGICHGVILPEGGICERRMVEGAGFAQRIWEGVACGKRDEV